MKVIQFHFRKRETKNLEIIGFEGLLIGELELVKLTANYLFNQLENCNCSFFSNSKKGHKNNLLESQKSHINLLRFVCRWIKK